MRMDDRHDSAHPNHLRRQIDSRCWSCGRRHLQIEMKIGLHGFSFEFLALNGDDDYSAASGSIKESSLSSLSPFFFSAPSPKTPPRIKTAKMYCPSEDDGSKTASFLSNSKAFSSFSRKKTANSNEAPMGSTGATIPDAPKPLCHVSIVRNAFAIFWSRNAARPTTVKPEPNSSCATSPRSGSLNKERANPFFFSQ